MPIPNLIHKKIFFLSVVIALGLILAWAFIKYQSTQKELLPAPISTSTPQSPAVSAPTSTVSTDITQETQTYINTEYGFKFQYPKDWEVKENIYGSPASKFNLIAVPHQEKYLPDPILVNITTLDFVNRSFSDLENIATKVVVGGIVGKKYEYEFESMQRISIILPFGKHQIILGAEKQYENVFNQVLASFKFLNQGTAEWKIYKNDRYGFEYQYPPNLVFKEINFPTYTFTDSGEICKNLFQEDSRSRRLLNQTTLIDPTTKFKIEVVTVDVYNNVDNLSLDDWLNSGAKFLEKYSKECEYDDSAMIEIRLDNKKSVTIDSVIGIEGFTGCCMVSNKVIYFLKNDKVYKLSFSGTINDEMKCVSFSDYKYSCPTISEDIFNQIISTFKFLK